MNRLEFLKRFGLLAAVAAIVPGCATHRGGADSDDDEKHEHDEKREHDEKGEHDEKHEKHDEDDEKNERKPDKAQ